MGELNLLNLSSALIVEGMRRGLAPQRRDHGGLQDDRHALLLATPSGADRTAGLPAMCRSTLSTRTASSPAARFTPAARWPSTTANRPASFPATLFLKNDVRRLADSRSASVTSSLAFRQSVPTQQPLDAGERLALRGGQFVFHAFPACGEGVFGVSRFEVAMVSTYHASPSVGSSSKAAAAACGRGAGIKRREVGFGQSSQA